MTSKRKNIWDIQYKVLDVENGTYIYPWYSFSKPEMNKLIRIWNENCGYDKYELVEIEEK